ALSSRWPKCEQKILKCSKVHLYKDGHLEVVEKVPIDVLPVAFKNFPTMLDKGGKLFLSLRKYIVRNSGNHLSSRAREWLKICRRLVGIPTFTFGKTTKKIRNKGRKGKKRR
ncbi:hypothetical protein ACFL3G_13600, partial [Planctomycetota bacterium]